MTGTAKVGYHSEAPKVLIQPAKKGVKLEVPPIKDIVGNVEQYKYEEAWKNPDYRKVSPGEMCLPIFMETVKPPRNATFVDWGSGTGRAAHQAWRLGCRVKMLDFVDHCLDDYVKDDLCDTLEFVKHDITKPIDARGDYAYCCDVLEHIPEEDVDKVLKNVLTNCREAFFNISTVEDHFGPAMDIGHLHVTVRPYSWWLKKFSDMECVVLHSNEFQHHCLFHVSAHKNLWWTRGGVNTSQEKIHENIRANKKWGVQQLTPHGEQDVEVLLLAGGPSLNDFKDEIIERRNNGAKLVTVNGAYNWAIEHGIAPSLQFLLDAREFNSRFVEQSELTKDTKFALASQCDPKAFELCPKDRTFMWQVSLEDDDIPVVTETYGEIYKDWFPVPGGCCVTLRAICALQMLGFRKLEVYGFDSCYLDGHHAYDQPENDKDPVIDVRVARGTRHEKTFKCADWMAVQAKEFTKLTPIYFDNMDLVVHGDGLISYLIKTGASL